jgi:hypothetical protein
VPDDLANAGFGLPKRELPPITDLSLFKKAIRVGIP